MELFSGTFNVYTILRPSLGCHVGVFFAVVLPQWADGVVRVTATSSTSQHNTSKHISRVCVRVRVRVCVCSIKIAAILF